MTRVRSQGPPASPSRLPQRDIKRRLKSLPGCPLTPLRQPPGQGHSGEAQSLRYWETHRFVLFKNTDMKNWPQSFFDKLCNFSTQIKPLKPLEGINGSMGQGWQDWVSHLSFLLITGTLQKAQCVSDFAEGVSFSIQPQMSMAYPFLLFISPHASHLSEILTGL